MAHATARRLRHLRRWLGWLAVCTALLIGAACRFESAGRAFAAVGAIACLIAWVFVLDSEGRLAEQVEARPSRRRAMARAKGSTRPAPRRPERRRAA